MVKDEENKIFNLAADFVVYSNKSLFLTGKAGTGKTTFLKYIREHCPKKMAVTAPTGVAAINAGGVTLHSFFQLPFGTYISDKSTEWGVSNHLFYNRKQLLGNLRLRQTQRDLIKSLELLIIDEVSMVRADLLDAIDTVLRSVRRAQNKPFGGVQLLLIGDLHQLPPVVNRAEEQILYEAYPSPFFFDAHVMKELDYVPVTLKKIYRQQDEEFINLLNKVRTNTCGQEEYNFLNKYYNPSFVPEEDSGFITLTTHNKTAASINNAALKRLSGKEITLEAIVRDKFPENAYPADWELRIKPGAQIMFIKNDTGEYKRYFNGKIGKIEQIDDEEGQLEISFPDESENIIIEQETWDNITYEYDNEKDVVKETKLGSFSQFPIRLAWAVTIHKSQGLTFDKAVIDAGRSFAPGQVYVALSRLTGLSGLVLHSKINSGCIFTNSRISEFSNQTFTENDYEQFLESAQKQYAWDLLLSAYEWQDLEESCMLHYQAFQSRQIPDMDLARKIASDLLDKQTENKKVAQKFQNTLVHLLETENYSKIQERNKAASDWFLKQIDEDLQIIRKHIADQNGKTKVKKYISELNELLTLFERKTELLIRSVDLTVALSQTKDIRNAMVRFSAPIKTSEKIVPVTPKKKKGESKRLSLAMYQQGKTIEDIAKERGLVVSTIEGHLIDFIPTGEVSFTAFVEVDDALEILETAKEMENPTSSLIREKLNEKYSYIQIRAALALKEIEEGLSNQ